MNFVKKIALVSLVGLFIGLTLGIDIYSVHCSIRGKTFVSLQSGMDPCFLENEEITEEIPSCCVVITHCDNEVSDESHNCCDEEEVHLSYDPDSFSHLKISLPNFYFISDYQAVQFGSKSNNSQERVYALFPQPPPLQGRELSEIHCVWRI